MYVIRTLGGLEVRSAEAAVVTAVTAQPKRAALLCYLATARPVGWQPRDVLLALFWPELGDEHARNALNQAVSFLRRALTRDSILSRGDELSVNHNQIGCDTIDFLRCLGDNAFERGLALYQGDYLHGLHVSDAPDFEHWLDQQRTHLRDRAAWAAAELVTRHEAAGNPNGAVEWAIRSSALAPYDEERARKLILLLHEAGQSARALAVFDVFAQRLWNELELKTSDETRELVARIRKTAAARSPSRAATEAPDLEGLLRSELAPDLELVRMLGRGSTAVAYLAREPALRRLVTVKVLRPQLAADPVARHRFEREGQAAARISHTHVASVYRVGRLELGIPYLVIEYVDGRSLEDMLAARGALSELETRHVLHALAAALTAAHRKDVIHRDVRPGNVFLEHNTGRVVLTDFGIASLATSGRDNFVQVTPAGQVVGDLRYASPEQARGLAVTASSDIYALAVTACEALTGNRPTGVADAASISVSADLRDLLQRCLAVDPNRRPRAEEVVSLLTSTTAPQH